MLLGDMIIELLERPKQKGEDEKCILYILISISNDNTQGKSLFSMRTFKVPSFKANLLILN